MSKLERAAPLSGIVAMALLIAGALLVNFYEYLPDPEKIQSFLTDNSTRVGIGAYVGLLAAFPMFWFAGSVRVFLRKSEPSGRLSAVAFGGGVAAGAVMAAGYAVLMAASSRAGDSIDVVGAVTLYDLSASLMGSAIAIALGVMIAAYAVVGARSGTVGSWFVGVSAFVAFGSVTPFGYLFLVADVLWIVYVSIDLYRRTGRRAAGA